MSDDLLEVRLEPSGTFLDFGYDKNGRMVRIPGYYINGGPGIVYIGAQHPFPVAPAWLEATRCIPRWRRWIDRYICGIYD